MGTIVQARLDRDSEQALKRLIRRMGWSPSEVVRKGVRLLAACHGAGGATKIIGTGQFDSGIRDLGSNKAHLKGFGR